MNFTILLKAAAIVYEYDEQDKKDVRQMAITDRAGLTTALESDPLLPWVAYEHGLIDEAPNGQLQGPGGCLPVPLERCVMRDNFGEIE